MALLYAQSRQNAHWIGYQGLTQISGLFIPHRSEELVLGKQDPPHRLFAAV